MRPLARLGFAIGLAGAAALVSGCDKMSLDPDKLDFTLFDTKTKLPGERKEVFPGGVPGVTPGVPPELVKGYHDPADTPTPADQKAAEAKPKPTAAADAAPPAEQKAAEAKPKPAPKPHVVQQPKPQPAQTASVQGTAPAASTAPAAPAAQAPGSQPAPWPGQPQQQAQPQASWPAPSPGR
jgi:hypothetical protein